MKFKILVVEDSAAQAEAVFSLLKKIYDVSIISNAEEALECLNRGQFDLVLSGIRMSGISGYDLCRRIKNNPQLEHTPFVFLTNLVDPLDIVRGLEAGADNYITKPFEPDHLLARIDQVLNSRRLRQSSRASMGVRVDFLGIELNITSDKEQILDLLLSSIEDIIRTNRALQESRANLAEANEQLERYARGKAREADVSKERYSTLMQQAGDAILVLYTDGTIAEANARAVDLLGCSQNQIVGRSLEDFIAEDQRGEHHALIERLIKSGMVDPSQRKFRRIDGSIVFCEGTHSIAEVTGSETLILAIYRDITDRREAEAALRRQEMHLREAQEIAQLGSWETDVEAELVTFSDRIRKIYGLAPGESVRNVAELQTLIHLDDHPAIEAARRQAINEQRPFVMEFRVLAGDGVTRVASVRGRPELNSDGRVTRVIGVMQDITEQSALEQQFLQAQKMEAIGRFAGRVAHDFNNILMAMNGSVHFLAEDLGPEHPSYDDVSDIERAVERAARLTRQLLAFSRQQVLEPQVVDLSVIVQEQQRMLRRLLPVDIEIQTAIAPDIWNIRADPGQLEQVLMNLVVNSNDALPNGGIVKITLSNVDVTAEFTEVEAGIDIGPHVLLIVEDTGEGIPNKVLPHIFEPFFTTKKPGKGTGLGLSIVYGIVQQSDGQIIVSNGSGGGAKFDIYFPRSEDEPEQWDVDERAITGSETIGTVLLVEDEPDVRRSLARVLRRHGHEVHEASSGKEAIQIFETHREFDLVLSDIVMAKLSGVELAAHVHRSRPNLPVLLMSGYLEDEITRQGLSGSGGHFIQKPFDHRELMGRIADLIGKASHSST